MDPAQQQRKTSVSAPLQLHLLGVGSLVRDGEEVPLPTQKVKLLLAYLALENGRPHARTRLAALLWPDHTERDGRNSLRQALAQLRACLGERDAVHPLLTATRTVLRLDLRDHLEVDVLALSTLAATAQDASADALMAMEARIGGPMLDGVEAPESDLQLWLESTRRTVGDAALRVLDVLTGHRLAAQGYGEADALARRQLALRPTHEPAWRVRMEVAAAEGRRDAALALYEQCHETLLDALGVRPSEATVELQRRLVADQLPVVAPLPVAPAPRVRLRSLRRQLGPRRPLFGRNAERDAILAHFGEGRRLVTLQGPGGIGKTRLAEAVAMAAEAQLEIPVAWVGLTTATGLEDFTSACLDVLGVRWPESATARDALVDAFAGLDALLVLDEMEGVAAHRAHADALPALLEACPGLRVLVTSRMPLRLSDERVILVEGLGNGADAAALFRDRVADLHGSDFPCADDDVARVCEAVHGVPLTLELAARLTRTLSVQDLARLLPDAPELLRDDAHDSDERHRSVEAVFASTWKTLSPSARIAAARCGTFRGPFELEAATAVAGLTPALLAELIDSSVVRQVSHRRYGLHTYLRELCLRELDAMEPDGRTARRHTDHFCARVETLVPRAYGPFDAAELFAHRVVVDPVAWAALNEEHADLGSAVRARLATGTADAAEPVVSLWWAHLSQRGRWAEGDGLLAFALECHPVRGDAAGAPQVLWTLLRGTTALSCFALDAAITWFERTQTLLAEAPVEGWRRKLELGRLLARLALPLGGGARGEGPQREAILASASMQLVVPYVLRAGLDPMVYTVARGHRHAEAGPTPPGVRALVLSTVSGLAWLAGLPSASEALRADAEDALHRVEPAALRAGIIGSMATRDVVAGVPPARIAARLEETWASLPPTLRQRVSVSEVARSAIGSLYLVGDLPTLRRWVDRGLSATAGAAFACRVVFLAYDLQLDSLYGHHDRAWQKFSDVVEQDRTSGRVEGERILVNGIGALVATRAGRIDAALELSDRTLDFVMDHRIQVTPWTSILAAGPLGAYAQAAERAPVAAVRRKRAEWVVRSLGKAAGRVAMLGSMHLYVQGLLAQVNGRRSEALRYWEQAVRAGKSLDSRLPAALAAGQLARGSDGPAARRWQETAEALHARMTGP